MTDIYRQVPILWRKEPDENPWGLSFLLMFMMNTDAGLFRTNPVGDVYALYEAKLVHHFDHRFATYAGATEAQLNKGTLPRLAPEQHDDTDFKALPRYWVDHSEVDARLARRAWTKGWLLGWRRSARSVDERTMISSIIPLAAVGDSEFLMLPGASVENSALLVASLSSFVLDYVTRQKMAGANVSFFIVEQLPIPSPKFYGEAEADFIRVRVLELTYTSWNMESFARDLGDEGPPFRWDEDRRFLMRAELDALYFHLYGIDRDDVDYIMETFPIVKRKDIQAHGTYRTKDTILAIYDQMTVAKAAGTPYQTTLTRPPGNGPRHPSNPE